MRTGKAAFNACSKDLRGLFASEALVRQNAQALIDEVRSFFSERNYKLALACLDLLLEKKGTSLRKDGLTPNFVHELRPVMNARALLEEGLIPATIKNHGSAEMLFCALLLHDLGEDFGLASSNVKNRLNRIINGTPGLKRPERAGLYRMSGQAVAIMEMMTFERTYTREEAENIIQTAYGPKQAFDPKAFEKLIVSKLFPKKKAAETVSVNLNSKGEFMVSCYGSEWNSYVDGMMKSPWAILAKYFDRCEGLATRLGVQAFSPLANRDYLQDTRALFMYKPTQSKSQQTYPRLARAFACMDSDLRILHHSLDICLVYFNEAENRKRTFEPDRAEPVDFSGYAYAMKLRGKTPAGLDFIDVSLERLKGMANYGNDTPAGEREKNRVEFIYRMITQGLNNLHRDYKSWSFGCKRMRLEFTTASNVAKDWAARRLPQALNMI